MKSELVAVFDSGIGGLNVLYDLEKNFTNVNFGYFGDNSNAPYGDKSEKKLLELFIDNYQAFSNYKVKAIVLACNTLSVSIRERIEDYSGVKVFGVFPPVEKELLKDKKVALLATPTTIEKYKNLPVTLFSLSRLAKEIELNVFNIDNVTLNQHLPSAYTCYKGYDTVILGCTHYDYVKNKIIDHFCPKKILSGKENTIDRLREWLKKYPTPKNTSKNQVIFLGENSNFNNDVYFKVVKRGKEE